MTDRAKKAKILDFRMSLGSTKSWGEFHRSVALDAIIAHLVCPKGRRRRTGIYLRLLDGDLDDLREIAGGSPELAARCEAIDEDIGRNRRLTRFKGSPGTYRRKLFGDLTRLRSDAVFLPGDPTVSRKLAKRQRKFGREVKNVLTAGCILLTMVWADEHSPSREFGPEAAKDFLCVYGKALGLGSLIKTNRSGLDEAWRKKRPVAHLAAALLHFIEALHTARFGEFGAGAMARRHRLLPAERGVAGRVSDESQNSPADGAAFPLRPLLVAGGNRSKIEKAPRDGGPPGRFRRGVLEMAHGDEKAKGKTHANVRPLAASRVNCDRQP